MTMMYLMMILILMINMSSNLPFNFIILLISTAILGSTEIAYSSMIFWLPIITIMLFVGGLMIIYIFIMSMNSDVIMKEKNSILIIIPLILITLMASKKMYMNSKMKGSSMFSLSWWYILIMMCIILIPMMMMSKIILSPLKPSKKMK